MDEVNQICADDKKVFAMEPTSCMDTRLTLKDFYSDGLESDYNAIYRTEQEYRDVFAKLNCDKIFVDYLFEDLSDFTETKYMYYVIE